jgi:peptidyl-prolyl cis-trans isomerase SurA
MPVNNAKGRMIGKWLEGALVAACLLAPAVARAQVVVIANGSPITELDIRQLSKLMTTGGHKAPTRQEVINALIDDRLKISKGKFYGLDLSNEEVDAAFNDMAKRQHISAEQFAQALDHAGISASTVKTHIRAEMTWTQLVRGKFGSSLQVGDADITKMLRARNEAENTVGYIYVLYPVTIVVSNVSDAAAMEAKRHEAENLRERFVSCKSGLALARAQRDVAVREPITKSSGDLPEALRDLLAKLEVGRLSTPDVTAQGLQMFALCSKKQSAEESPVKNELRQQIYASRFEAESKRYLDEVRKSAMIEYK